MINKPPPLSRDYNRDPNIKALTQKGFINHGPYITGQTQPLSFVTHQPASKYDRYVGSTSYKFRVEALTFRNVKDTPYADSACTALRHA